MKKLKSVFLSLFVLILIATATFSILTLLKSSRINENNNQVDSKGVHTLVKQEINLVALGDSLTKGVGDLSRRGGYVPIAADMLEDSDYFSSVYTFNAGKSGAVASEVREHLQTDERVRSAVSNADLLTLSVGGNNLVRTFRRIGLNPTREAFEQPLEEYEQELVSLFMEIREINSEAPIYLFGIYNPYYIYFSEIEPLQELVDSWNLQAEATTEQFDHVYFVPIDSLFNSTDSVISGEEVEETTEEIEKNHPYLFQGDYFHPNEQGYQLMAEALVELMKETWMLEHSISEGE